MEAMAQTWSDDRLDRLNSRVDKGFARLEQRIEASEERLNGRIEASEERLNRRIDESAERMEAIGDRLNARIDESSRDLRLEFNARFDNLESRFDRMQQTIMVTGGGIVATLIATCVAALAG
jgi:DNA anti-recombination protein RmuC